MTKNIYGVVRRLTAVAAAFALVAVLAAMPSAGAW